mmetsp:Transcript_28665/g.31835  ORF Transcript_28665/g.31835 Transcript_28665/m.31835 type:complete len:277 (+) Transcript_28665:63-893(+)
MFNPEVFRTNSFGDYHQVLAQLTEKGLLGKEQTVCALIGCSGHSVIQKRFLQRVADAIGINIIQHRGVSVLWTGGDPAYRRPQWGGNITDIKTLLISGGYVQTGACVQRSDWVHKSAKCDKYIIGYDGDMAVINGKKTFGGWSNAPPKGFLPFLATLRKKCINVDFLAPEKIYPSAASCGYLMALPSMAKDLILIVIPRAGYITFKETEYVYKLLKRRPKAPVHVYCIRYPEMKQDLNNVEKRQKCKIDDTLKVCASMKRDFPSNITYIDVDTNTK